MKKLCLIDLGSNSARMSMAELTDAGYVECYRRRQMARLSEGMQTDGILQEAAQTRAISALSDFAKEAKEENAPIIAIATAAVRRAKNGPAFCERVFAETGITLSVISGKQEAYFDFYGVLSSLPEEKDCLIMDLGGGSVELILVKDKEMQGKISLPFGAMTLTDRFFREHSDLAGAREMISSLFLEVGILEQAKGLPIIALGGSAGALPPLDAQLRNQEKPEVHGYSLTQQDVQTIFDILYQIPPEKRISDFALEPGRADTICAGILPHLLLMEQLGSPYLKTCTAGLREGILALLSHNPNPENMPNPSEIPDFLVGLQP